MEQNPIQDFHPHIFNAIFLLTLHSSVFQILPWNWKHLTNWKVHGKKAFWLAILHSYLYDTLCKFFTKIESRLMFSQNIFWNWEHMTSQFKQGRNCFVLFHESFWSKSKARGGAKLKNRHPSWLYSTVVGLSEAATGGVL